MDVVVVVLVVVVVVVAAVAAICRCNARLWNLSKLSTDGVTTVHPI